MDSNRGRRRHQHSGTQQNENPQLDYADYTVGWVSTLPNEYAAAYGVLDRMHKPLLTLHNDSNVYTYGNIGMHNIVLVCLGCIGTNTAGRSATHIERSFPNIRFRLIVGVGGGAPTTIEGYDMRLGDVVVADKVIQYDQGKVLSDGKFERTEIHDYPEPILVSAMSTLEGRHMVRDSELLAIGKEALCRHSRMADSHSSPNPEDDKLFKPEYKHVDVGVGVDSSPCKGCSSQMLVERPERVSNHPKIHRGTIASGNQLRRDAITRDEISRELKTICFDMEAAGLMREYRCLSIRGICDYSDSHKNNRWQGHAALMAAAYAKELLQTIDTGMSEKANKENKKKREHLLKLIDFDFIGSRESDVRPAHGQTCSWILRKQEYAMWKDTNELPRHCGVLWVGGKPGSGKSTIMKFLLENQQAYQQAAEPVVLSFFFHARGFTLQSSVEGMYRSLLHQLLTACPELQSVLDTVKFPRRCPPTWHLQDLFSMAVLRLKSSGVTVFIDAVDECAEEEGEMVEFFENLSRQAVVQGLPLRLCFSSRHYPYIDIRHGLKLTLEHQTEHQTDLEMYLEARLRFNMDENFPGVRTQILEKAAGVFLWVVLVVDILNEKHREGQMFAVHDTLNQLPTKLSDLFLRILNRDSKNMEHFFLSIQWILYSKRPLSLEEFYSAVCSGLRKDIVRNSIATRVDAEDMKRFATSSAKGLIEIFQISRKSQKAWAVRFIHESVRDFLVDYNGLAQVWPGLSENYASSGHAKLHRCCATYMELCNEISVSSLSRRLGLDRAFPFLSYAFRNIFHHANLMEDVASQNRFLGEIKLRQWILASSGKLYASDALPEIPANASLLYVLAEVNTPSLIRCGYFESMQLNDVKENTLHPLQVAISRGHGETVQAILELNKGIPRSCLLFDYVRRDMGQTSQGYGCVATFGMGLISWLHEPS